MFSSINLGSAASGVDGGCCGTSSGGDVGSVAAFFVRCATWYCEIAGTSGGSGWVVVAPLALRAGRHVVWRYSDKGILTDTRLSSDRNTTDVSRKSVVNQCKISHESVNRK